MKQQPTTGLDFKLHEMAQRIRDLREIVGLTAGDMARLTGVPLEEYLLCEAGESDLNFAFNPLPGRLSGQGAPGAAPLSPRPSCGSPAAPRRGFRSPTENL